MIKRYSDGTTVEGTPEEIRAYDQERSTTVIPMAPGHALTPYEHPVTGGVWIAPVARPVMICSNIDWSDDLPLKN